MMTFDEGRMRTCLLPFRSALTMLFKQSFKTETRVMMAMRSALHRVKTLVGALLPNLNPRSTHDDESCKV